MDDSIVKFTSQEYAIPFIDIADPQCWMVFLMPFEREDRSDYLRVDSFQRQCIEKKVFGMGWGLPCFEYGTPISEENITMHASKYKDTHRGGTISEDALRSYLSIKKNDYIIMRLKNSHYYVGRVSCERSFYIHNSEDPVLNRLSGGGTVERWIEFPTDGDVPSEIVGRFSQRRHPTIQRITPYRQRLLVIAMYENSVEKSQCRSSLPIPKIKISPSNFIASLNYMELEDLVAIYIADKERQHGYHLLPSSCKINQPEYEFRFVASQKKPITCQVKNKESIDINRYTSEEAYERIYIFSGMWSDDVVDELRKSYNDFNHIYVIKPSELFDALKSNPVFQSRYYDYEMSAILPSELQLDNYIEKEEPEKPNKENEYSRDTNYICFRKKDGLFYSSEFGALILSYHILGKQNYAEELDCARKVLADINAAHIKHNSNSDGGVPA